MHVKRRFALRGSSATKKKAASGVDAAFYDG
jgi:hypothetical protein